MFKFFKKFGIFEPPLRTFSFSRTEEIPLLQMSLGTSYVRPLDPLPSPLVKPVYLTVKIRNTDFDSLTSPVTILYSDFVIRFGLVPPVTSGIIRKT